MRSEKGSILVIVLVAVAVFVILGGALLNVTMAGIQVAGHFAGADQAYYAAEAGVEKAISYLNRDFRREFDNELDEDGFTVSVSDVGNNRLITSTGTAGGKTRTIQVLLSIEPFYSNALLSTKDVTMIDSEVTGPIHASGLVTMNGSKVLGNVHVHNADFKNTNFITESLRYKNSASISGSGNSVHIEKPYIVAEHQVGSPKTYYHSNASELSVMYDPDLELSAIPPIDFSIYTNDMADNPDDWIVLGNTDWEVSALGEDYQGKKIFIDGNLKIGKQNSADEFIHEGLIVVTGRLNVFGQINNNRDERLIIIIDGDVSFVPGQAVDMGGRTLIYSNSKISIKPNSSVTTMIKIKGIFIARDNLTIEQVELAYNTDMLLMYPDLLPGIAPVKREWINPNPRR